MFPCYIADLPTFAIYTVSSLMACIDVSGSATAEHDSDYIGAAPEQGGSAAVASSFHANLDAHPCRHRRLVVR